MTSDALPPPYLVEEAVGIVIEEFDEEMDVTVHAQSCPMASMIGDAREGCLCNARTLTVPGKTVAAVWWWMRRLTWRMTRK